MMSIRRQLIGIMLAGLCVLFLLSGTMLYLHVHHTLLSQFDDHLLGKAQTFIATSEHEDDAVEFEFEETPIPAFQPSDRAEYFQVLDETGDTLVRSPSLENRDLPVTSGPSATPRFEDILLPDGRAGRAVVTRFVPHTPDEQTQDGSEHAVEDAYQHATSETSLTLVMARSREDLDSALMAVLSGLCLTCLALLAGSACLVRWTVRRGLRPLDTVASRAASVDANSLACRFPAKEMPDELRPICSCLNELFERLEVSFDRERRFTADVAHELRTPIAELRSLAEVAIMEGRDAEGCHDGQRDFQDALDISLQMEQLVTVLLNLARCESGLQTVTRKRVDAARLAEETWAPFEKQARDRELSVNLDLPGPAFIETDPALLKAVLASLLSNAVTHTPRFGQITVTAEEETGGLAVTVSNTNSQLVPEDLEHIRDAFWRKDDARSDRDHTGVGLSLVTEYSRLLDIEVAFELPASDTFTVTLKHPKATCTDPC